jgi:hypothetical protein
MVIINYEYNIKNDCILKMSIKKGAIFAIKGD